MSDAYMDGFDHYGSGDVSTANLMTNSAYTDVQSIPVTAPTFCGVPSWGSAPTGPYCLVSKNAVSPAKTYAARYALPSDLNSIMVSLRYAMDSLPANNNTTSIIDFRNSSNVVMAYLAVTATGALQLRDRLNAVIATSTTTLAPQTFYFLEMNWSVTGTIFTLRVNDTYGNLTPAINVTNANIGVIRSLGIIPSNDTNSGDAGLFQYQYVDDLYVRSPSFVTSLWYGDRKIMWIPMTEDSTPQGWTPHFYRKISTGILTNTATNSAVTATAASSLDLGSGDFTLESFVRFNTLPAASSYSTIMGRWDAANNRKSYRLILGGSSFNNSSIQFDYSTDGATTVTPIIYPFAFDLNHWYHIALVRSSGNLLLFVDGVKLGLPIASASTYFSGGVEPLVLGRELTGASTPVANSGLTGWFDETRITAGFARYTSTFTPTTTTFPRGAGSDPQWSSVRLLCGYDTTISDESSFAQVMTPLNGAVQFSPTDGATVGNFSAVGKSVPDDNTFITAPLTQATNILTMTTQPAAGDTVRVATKTGPAPAVYTFRSSLVSAFDVLIDSTAQNTLLNLLNAINLGAGAGTKYGTGTTANLDVTAIQLPAGQIMVKAIVPGVVGNSLASTTTGSAASWPTTTLTGGVDMPTKSSFRLPAISQTIPVVSGFQIVQRAWKTDSVGSSLIVPGVQLNSGSVITSGGAVSPTTTPAMYAIIDDTDPATAGLIAPSVLTRGTVFTNRIA